MKITIYKFLEIKVGPNIWVWYSMWRVFLFKRSWLFTIYKDLFLLSCHNEKLSVYLDHLRHLWGGNTREQWEAVGGGSIQKDNKITTGRPSSRILVKNLCITEGHKKSFYWQKLYKLLFPYFKMLLHNYISCGIWRWGSHKCGRCQIWQIAQW